MDVSGPWSKKRKRQERSYKMLQLKNGTASVSDASSQPAAAVSLQQAISSEPSEPQVNLAMSISDSHGQGEGDNGAEDAQDKGEGDFSNYDGEATGKR